MTVWIKVTKDEFELPVAIADTAEELAEILGVDRSTILSAVRRYERGEVSFSVYRRLEIGDEEDE